MNFFESEILKGKYFPFKSRDRLRATMINLFILVGVSVMLLYAYENLAQGEYVMLLVELLIIFILMIAYVVFPHYVNIYHTSYIILGAFTFLLSMSLIIPDQDPELSLFWLAALPIFVFFFLGVAKGYQMEYEHVYSVAFYTFGLLSDRGPICLWMGTAFSDRLRVFGRFLYALHYRK